MKPINVIPTCRTCQLWTQDGPSAGTCNAWGALPLPGQVTLVGKGTYPPPLELAYRPGPHMSCMYHSPRPGQD